MVGQWHTSLTNATADSSIQPNMVPPNKLLCTPRSYFLQTLVPSNCMAQRSGRPRTWGRLESGSLTTSRAEWQSYLVAQLVASAVVRHVEAVLDVGWVAVGEGPEEPVPNAQHVPIIPVRPRHLEVVVKLVHVMTRRPSLMARSTFSGSSMFEWVKYEKDGENAKQVKRYRRPC